MKGEEWREVVGFPGYRVSDRGRVQSKRLSRGKEWRDLSPRPGWRGYLRVALIRDGRACDMKVHRLVLLAFVGPCPDGMQACHAPDPNPVNNHLKNLRWGTPKDNASDTASMGRLVCGERHPAAKLNGGKVGAIRSALADGKTASEIAKLCGVTRRTIEAIRDGRKWKHVV